MTGKWTGGLAALLAALAITVPGTARANETLHDAGRCAVRYLQVLHSTPASQIIEGYNNIDVRDRAWHLIRTYELAPPVPTGGAEFTENLNRFVKGQTGSLTIGRHFDTTILPELPIQEDRDSGEQSRKEGAIAALAECDLRYGFTPVVALGDQPSGPTIDVREDLFVLLKNRADRIAALGDTPPVRMDRWGDHPNAISLKNTIQRDGVVDASEKALLRAIFSSEPTLGVRHAGQRLEVMNLRYRGALSVLLPFFSNYDCAMAYWLHGAFNAGERQGALQRANHALNKHMEGNPGEQRAAAEQQLMVEGQARGERIQQGQESVDGLTSDLRACEVKYGFAQTGRQ